MQNLVENFHHCDPDSSIIAQIVKLSCYRSITLCNTASPHGPLASLTSMETASGRQKVEHNLREAKTRLSGTACLDDRSLYIADFNLITRHVSCATRYVVQMLCAGSVSRVLDALTLPFASALQGSEVGRFEPLHLAIGRHVVLVF